MTEEPLLSVRDLKKHYPIRKGLLNRQVGAARAVDGISFDIAPGETLGLVGESGCGKSTAATSIVRLEEPTGGEVIFNGGGRSGATRNADGTHPNDVTRFDDRELKAFRRDAQMIFQDPSSSFDPRMSVGGAVAEMLQIHGMSDRHRRRAIVEDLLERVGLSPEDYDRYPHEFSGGQKQRIALARALVLNPELIVADEPVSALDVSIQAEILDLIADLQSEFDLSLLFISHDMSVIREICDRVAVMYLGEIVEIGPTDRVFADPQHPYTEALLSAIPTPDPRSTAEGIELTGTVPSPTNPPSGCRFHTRCHRVIQPDDVDLDQSSWRGLLNLRDALAADSVDVDQIRENFRTGTDTGATPDAVKGQIRREFDLEETISSDEMESLLDAALDEALDDDLDAAAATLSERVTTPCEERVPQRTSHEPGHESACHLHERDRSAPPNPADD
ncbi:peptide ABC transporter ATP-binding protein [Halorubrum sp. Ib24]|uniref:ABC transporter ATP-binding protein n=1 Tax=Halorubrum sp. Ib24 TaxID=1383850 RepID=UPI000B987DCB|nr:oligopeptide/dipeptide ABC transporter ATP-binding protein [Halorubrum sp. Ib24]OYR40212.1 peptide ABC transporter ATP-binding protein [Halorubrum sp. Ib24]